MHRMIMLVSALALVACGPERTASRDGGSEARQDSGSAPSDAGEAADAASDLIARDCRRFCSGVQRCLEAMCPLAISEAEFTTRCVSECRASAVAMSADELAATVACLDCMEAELPADSCDSAAIQAAETTCNATSTCSQAAPRQLISDFQNNFDFEAAFNCP